MATDYRKLFESVEQSAGYWATIPLAEFSRSISELLKADGISRAELARRLGHSRPYVSKILGGQENITVTTMAKFAMALGAVVRVHVAKRNAVGLWIEVRNSTDATTLSIEHAPAAISLPSRGIAHQVATSSAMVVGG